MGHEYLLGIDIGTSACKIAVFTKHGTIVCQRTEEYKTIYPSMGYVEQNPLEWWKAVCKGIHCMFAETNIHPGEIKGIGIDGQSGSAIPVNKQGNVLRNALIWLDQRSSKQCEALKRTIGEDKIFTISGNPLAPSYTTGKIVWIKEHEPAIYKDTHKFLQCNSFIVYKLTGNFTHDLSQGNGVHAFDIEKGQWDYDLSEQMGIKPSLLAPLFDSSEVVGEVTNKAAVESGLAKGTPVVAGGLDAACGTLGAGAIHQGETQEQGGQAGGMSIVIDQAVKSKKLILSNHVVSGKWILQGGTVGGGSLKWFKKELVDGWNEAHTSFEQLSEIAGEVQAGSNGLIFLPYMAGERSPIWDVDAKGVFLGLSYGTTKAHMIRAIMEGCAFALNHNLKTAEEENIVVRELFSMGGAANSYVWSQIKANITGKLVKIPSSDTATTLGAAILAGVGIGMYNDFHEAVECTVHINRVHQPNPHDQAVYDDLYKVYLETYNRLKGLFPRLRE
jgi:xylulokinase